MTSDSAVRITATVAALLVAGAALAGCTDVAGPVRSAEAVPTAPSAAPTFPEVATPSPSPTTTDLRRAQYEAETASWTEPLPPGYSWPRWDDLPHTWGAHGVIPFDNATGVYRCILISAAWHAYFEDDDPVASTDYATRADEYVIPDNPSSIPVTENAVIVDSSLATASGICQAITGPLP